MDKTKNYLLAFLLGVLTIIICLAIGDGLIGVAGTLGECIYDESGELIEYAVHVKDHTGKIVFWFGLLLLPAIPAYWVRPGYTWINLPLYVLAWYVLSAIFGSHANHYFLAHPARGFISFFEEVDPFIVAVFMWLTQLIVLLAVKGIIKLRKQRLLLCILMIFCVSCQAPNGIVHDFDNTVAGALCADDADHIYVSTPTTHEIVRIPKVGGKAVSLGFTGERLLVQGDTLYFTNRNRAGAFSGDLYAYALTGDADPVCIASQSDSIIQYYPVGEQFFVWNYLTEPAMLDAEDGTAESLPYEIYLRVTEDESVGMDITGVEIDEETTCYPVYRTQGTEKTHLFDFYVFYAIHPKVNNYCFFDCDVMYHVSDPDGVYTFTDNTCITRVAPDESGVYRSEILYECTDSLRLLGVGNGNLYAQNHDGTVLYVIGTDGVCRSKVPLDPDAKCFVGNTDGLLYSVNTEDMTYQTFGGE